MSDPETFVTEVYVLVDTCLPALVAELPRRPGPPPALAPSEVVTLALVSRLPNFHSGRHFYDYVEQHVRPLFPTLPHRTQFVRQVLRLHRVITRLALTVADQLASGPYEVLDSTAVPLRNRARRGRGWLPGIVDVGSSSRWHWYAGVHLLTSVSPAGVATGFGCAPASVNDRVLAESFFAARSGHDPELASAGHPLTGIYLADTGFGGQACEQRWSERYGAFVLSPPQSDRKTRRWTRETQRWAGRHRQIIETVFARIQGVFRLGSDRPHTLAGLLATIASVMAIHNLTILLNRQHHHPPLSSVHLVDW